MESTFTLLLLFFVYLSLITSLSLFKPKYISSKKIYLFRALFPSWKFYDDIGHMPVLYFRSGETAELSNMPWIEAIEKLDRSWKNLFLNPQGNLYHAYNSLLQQLDNDKEEAAEGDQESLIHSVSYKLVLNLIRAQIQKTSEEIPAYFQFKVTSVMQGSPTDAEDTLISPVHPFSEG